MDKKLSIALVATAVAFSVFVFTSPNDPIPLPEPSVNRTQDSSVEILAQNLRQPRSIAVSEDRIFVTEKGGTIRVIKDGTLLAEPLASMRPADAFNGGLLGMALDPDFDSNRFIYVFLTYEQDGLLWNKILRITESKDRLAGVDTIFDKIPGSAFSNGGFLKFGPDKKLYVGTGSVSDSSHMPQSLDSLSGKILRLNPDGTIPADNPFPGSAVYSYGHRDPQGMAWDESGNMYLAELGPDKNDEINLVVPGGNYGWPEYECGAGGKEFVGAVLCYDPSIEPGGILHYSGDKIDLESPFVMASLRATNLYQLDFEEGLPSQKSILSGLGRVRDVAQGPDGSLYVITSNTDGKGFPDSKDDRLLRILK